MVIGQVIVRFILYRTLNKTDNVQTFAVGFALVEQIITKLVEKVEQKPFICRMAQLLAKLTDAIKLAISGD